MSKLPIISRNVDMVKSKTLDYTNTSLEID
jgi:hypothetical protein